MNKWVKESLSLAAGQGYLDKLSKVYPVSINTIRVLSGAEKKSITAAFKKGNGIQLINTLLNFKRFPIDDPYIGFIRKDANALSKNPKTLKRISDHLFGLGIDGIVAGIQRPMSSSRQFGQLFRSYARNLGFKIFTNEDIFLNSNGVAIFDGGDAELKRIAKKHFGYNGRKGLDLILKKNKHVFLGEAKFISTSGGTQAKSFRETMSFVKMSSSAAKHIAIIDGVIWAQGSSYRNNLYGQLHKLSEDKYVMSALLLKRFINSL